MLDRDGRLAGWSGAMDFGFKTFPGAVDVSDAGALHELAEDCRRTMTAREVGLAGLSPGETFFVAAGATPRCGLEALALSVFRLHTRGATFDPETSGAEWWTQVIDADDDIGFHWDQDYGVADCGVNVHPHLATVTYLSTLGGPTIVLDHASPVQHGADFTARPQRCWVSRPALGKHMCFDGRLLHAAPSDFCGATTTGGGGGGGGGGPPPVASPVPRGFANLRDEDGRVLRVTFLVNVWLNYTPVGPRYAQAAWVPVAWGGFGPWV